MVHAGAFTANNLSSQFSKFGGGFFFTSLTQRCFGVARALIYYLFVFTELLRDILDEVDHQKDLEFDEAVKEKGGFWEGLAREDHWILW